MPRGWISDAKTNPKSELSIPARIARTPVLQLERLVPKSHARISIKLESENATGSMKDRPAKAQELGPGKTVVTIVVDSGMKYLSTADYGNTD